MRRGTEATWQSPGSPRGAHVALTCGRRPRRRAHANAREGRHVAGKAGKWRAHGLVGPWLDIRGGNTLALNRPPYLTADSPDISSVWDYVPTRFYLACDVDAWRASDLTADGYDRVDPSPHDQKISTCLKYRLSEAIDTVPFATWKSRERPIFVEMDGWRWTHFSIAIRRLR